MSPRKAPDCQQLDAAGLNRLHVFDLADLPAGLGLPDDAHRLYRQLLLIGHAGRKLWTAVQQEHPAGPDPIDDFTLRHTRAWLAQVAPDAAHRFLYPGNHPVGLQRLGQLAGWHHPSPFMIGIDPVWGSWFAYRAAVLTDTDFTPTPKAENTSPCPTCASRPCITACPADALQDGKFNLDACSTWRLREDSPCATGCLARLACPVGREHRYDTAQIRHSYAISLAWLRRNGAKTA